MVSNCAVSSTVPDPPAERSGLVGQEQTRFAAPLDEIGGRSQEDVAGYVAHMATEMAAMSRAAGYDLLAHFLEMARIEAKIHAEKVGG